MRLFEQRRMKKNIQLNKISKTHSLKKAQDTKKSNSLFPMLNKECRMLLVTRHVHAGHPDQR